MKAVIQRVNQAKVTVNQEVIGKIDHGLVVLLGIAHEDTMEDVTAIVNKMIHLRIFEDEDNKMNLSLKDVDGSILSISQFTLYGDIRKGRRPSFVKAANPDDANNLYEKFNDMLRKEDIHVETGEFGAMMDVALTNAGPVTIIMETENGKILEA